MQTDGLPYPNLFLTAVYDYALLYKQFGLPEFIQINFPLFTSWQQADGLFVDTSLSHGQTIFCGHGQPLSAIADDAVDNRNTELGKQYFNSIKKGVECIMNDSATQPHGLMRALIPYDNYVSCPPMYAAVHRRVADHPFHCSGQIAFR